MRVASQEPNCLPILGHLNQEQLLEAFSSQTSKGFNWHLSLLGWHHLCLTWAFVINESPSAGWYHVGVLSKTATTGPQAFTNQVS